ncbi:MAG: nucleotidyltransferase family protein, partial [Clostridia bacterium]|nr:nucleotidyltransferase family protein [Clostridia bacterium]
MDGEITLAFGCESGNKDDFLKTAAALNCESEQFKRTLAALTEGGESYIKAYAAAFEACGGDPSLLKNPNNILGVEYTKAALRSGKNIEILPVERVGSSFKDEELKENFSSASAIRANADNPLVIGNMPKCSYDDFINSTDNTERFENLVCDTLFLADTENLKRIFGCTEGLENRLKKFADTGSFEDVLEQSSNKRYSKARIRRIM